MGNSDTITHNWFLRATSQIPAFAWLSFLAYTYPPRPARPLSAAPHTDAGAAVPFSGRALVYLPSDSATMVSAQHSQPQGPQRWHRLAVRRLENTAQSAEGTVGSPWPRAA